MICLTSDAESFTGAEKIVSIARGAYRSKGEDEIRGSGYVVDCLEAALWCFDRTDTFRDAILAAANLGDDADTTAAVCGQVAGAYYGESASRRSGSRSWRCAPRSRRSRSGWAGLTPTEKRASAPRGPAPPEL